MQEHNITNLSSFGYASEYYIDTKGNVYKGKVQLFEDNLHRVILRDKENRIKRITKKKLYRKVYNKEYCIDTIPNIIGEEWKEISDFFGKYWISNKGRVKSYCGNNAIILLPYEQKSGYLEVKLNHKNYKIHRLVANAFCQNDKPKEKTEVHHKDRNRKNNNVDNLLWLTPKAHREEHKKGVNNDEL